MTTEPTNPPDRRRVLSGMRPTGKLHLGNYMGALKNWVDLQNETDASGNPLYECYFFIADWHALTTDYADPSQLKQNIFEIALDFLSAGLDPDRSTIFIQSHVPQHTELHLLLSMITPVSWLERVPTYKDQQEQLREKDLATYGFLGYPLLQSADILVYQPQFVPVGQDQVAHVEITREIARRFNFLYGTPGTHSVIRSESGESLVLTSNTWGGVGITHSPINLRETKELLPEPQVLLTPSPKLPGTDGRKMSKSYGNSILLSELGGDVHVKLQSMSNGGQRPTQHDPGDPDICPVGDMHRVFSAPMILNRITQGCRAAEIRCDECKFMAANSINQHLQPIRNKREELEAHPQRVWDALDSGAVRAEARADQTMQAIRAVTGLSRDRSGVRLNQSALKPDDRKNIRDLSNFKDWWNLEDAFLNRNLREYWRKDIVPTDAALKQDSEGVWLTRNNRRVFATAAIQQPGSNEWHFSVKPKSYEILVLLCWGLDFLLRDFVIPQKLYLNPWTAGKRASGGKTLINFWVYRDGDQFHLQFADSAPILISETEASYGLIGI